LGHQCPVPTDVSGVSQRNGAEPHAITKEKAEEMFCHSTRTKMGTHWGRDAIPCREERGNTGSW